MTTLPTSPFQLHGSCFCTAIKYTLSIPSLTSRPLIPSRPSKPLGPQNEVNARLPCIALDHCTSCRRIPGSILQAWFICPQSWAEFSLELRSPSSSPDQARKIIPTQDLLIPSADLERDTYVKGFRSSEFAHRTFCARCGTHLTFFYTGPDQKTAEEGKWGPYFDLVLGSLDEESVRMEGLRPDRQIWVESGVQWVRGLVGEGEENLRE